MSRVIRSLSTSQVEEPGWNSKVREPAGWRTAALARVVALAIAAGLTISDGVVGGAALALGALGIVAATACLIDLGPSLPLARLIPVAEACLVAVIVTGAQVAPSTLLVYLAVPPLVAGIRLGPLSVVNAVLASILAAAAGGAALMEAASRVELSSRAGLWLAVGAALGVVAAVHGRRERALEVLQAPYEPIRRAASELYDMSRDLPHSLDPVGTARAIADAVAEAVGPGREGCGVAVYLAGSTSGDRPLAMAGEADTTMTTAEVIAAAEYATGARRSRVVHGLTAVPLRAGDRTLGSVVVAGRSGWISGDLDRLQRLVDEHAVQLEASLLFDRIRSMATTEERNRLARDLHDGAIQEVAALGYLVDDLVTSCTSGDVRAAAEQVRGELTRVVRELRNSVGELRHGLEAGDLRTALADHAEHVRRLCDIQVHLACHVTGEPVPPTQEAELLRVVQEALTNVRKHAAATNVWIDYHSDGTDLLLSVADDGTGVAGVVSRDGHFGLGTMAERARRVGAAFTIDERPGGGTRVMLRTRGASVLPFPPHASGLARGGASRDAHRAG